MNRNHDQQAALRDDLQDRYRSKKDLHQVMKNHMVSASLLIFFRSNTSSLTSNTASCSSCTTSSATAAESS